MNHIQTNIKSLLITIIAALCLIALCLVQVEPAYAQKYTPAHTVPARYQTERINFQPGATSTIRSGTVAMNGSITYRLWASAGQHMDLAISGADAKNTAFAIFSPSGDYLFTTESYSWSGTLPESGDYQIQIFSSLGIFDKHFDLSVSIVTPQPQLVQHQVERINFQPGATAATRSGTVAMNGSATYYLRAAAGQQMDLALTGFDIENVAMDVYGPDGQQLVGTSPYYWDGILPVSGDYQVRVYSILGLFDKRFNLNVSIITPDSEPVAIHHAERINFQPGATATSRSGSVAMNGSITYYLWTAAGQQMDLALTGPDTQNVAVDLYSPSGEYLFSIDPHRWSGTLPESGDYQIKVYSILGIFDKQFDLNVSIVH